MDVKNTNLVYLNYDDTNNESILTEIILEYKVRSDRFKQLLIDSINYDGISGKSPIELYFGEQTKQDKLVRRLLSEITLLEDKIEEYRIRINKLERENKELRAVPVT